MPNYFFSLSPYTTQNSTTVFRQSFPHSLSKRSISCFYRIATTPLCNVTLGHIPDTQLFLRPQPTHHRELQDCLSLLVSLFFKQKKHQFLLSDCGHAALLGYIRAHSQCSNIFSASAHTPQRIPRPTFISRFLIH
jgi:hypothetical protein